MVGVSHAKPRVYALGSARATERRFIAPDGSQRVYRFARGEPRDLTADRLAAQLAGAEYVGQGRHEPVSPAMVTFLRKLWRRMRGMADDRSDPPFKELHDVKMLGRDIVAMDETLTREDPAYRLRGSAASVGELCLWSVTLDLFGRTKECAAGVSILLARGAIVPVFPLLRQVYESFINLAYLSKQPDPKFAAQVAVAHEYARACWAWEQLEPTGSTRMSDPTIAPFRKNVDDLKGMRAALHLEGEARRLAETRRMHPDWTGKDRKQIIVDVTGSTDEYVLFYSRLSQVSHPNSLVGGYMRNARPEDMSGFARQTRMYLRDAWLALTHWMPIPLTHPWLDDPGTAL